MHSQQASIRAARLTKIAMDCVPDALSGRTLYGDDFSPKQITRWFSEEEEAYYRLARRNGSYCYSYHARNIEHGYRHLPRQEFGRVLGIGSAYGDELAPILQQCREITILEPSDGFRNERFAYTKPHPSGTTPFPDENFDLVTCLGVLHHVPNVSKLLREIGRVLKPSGYSSFPIPSFPWAIGQSREEGLPRTSVEYLLLCFAISFILPVCTSCANISTP